MILNSRNIFKNFHINYNKFHNGLKNNFNITSLSFEKRINPFFELQYSSNSTNRNQINFSDLKIGKFQVKKEIEKKKYWKNSSFDYDCIVIGGGSAGITFATNASSLSDRKARILLLDYVKPSHHGSVWGLGGTCASVGCIPKKLFHHATQGIKKISNDSNFDFHWENYGWKIQTHGFNWNLLTNNVQDNIKSSNFKFRSSLIQEQVEYLNLRGRIVDPNSVEITHKDGSKQIVTSDIIVIATGSRPRLPNIPGIEHSITSDDLFSLKKDPGRTLVIGAGYIAMECAGFLNSLPMKKSLNDELGVIKRPVSLMVRSQPLRIFDRQSVDIVVDNMKKEGIDFIYNGVPIEIKKIENENHQHELEVYYEINGKIYNKRFDTVLTAIGRDPQIDSLCNVEELKLKVNEITRKIITNDIQQTSVPNIYALGDVLEGGLELTPVAIQAGQLLAKRLFNNSNIKLDLINTPTTIFTPMEYSSIGYSEEKALKEFNKDAIVYFKKFNVLENALTKEKEQAFMKLITLKSENERVIGFHYVGPMAGEIAQGVAIAMKLRATKEDFDSTIGIHPTIAEQLTGLKLGVTEDTGCCAG